MLTKVYLVIGIVVLAGYSLVAFTGKEFGDPERQRVPADVRRHQAAIPSSVT